MQLLTLFLFNRIDDLNKHCLESFRKHWACLDNNNHQLWQCRKDEWKLNQCVFDNLVRLLNGLSLFIRFLEADHLHRNLKRIFPMLKASLSICDQSRSTPTIPSSEIQVRHRSRRLSIPHQHKLRLRRKRELFWGNRLPKMACELRFKDAG